MSVPNDIHIAQQLEAQGYFTKVATGDIKASSYFARLFAYTANPNGDPVGWGALKKGGGHEVEGYAEDAVVFGNGPNTNFNVADLVVGAGAAGAHLPPRLDPKERRIGVDEWERPKPLTAEQMAYLGGPPLHSTMLGISHFGALGLRLLDRPRYDNQLAWIGDGFDYARIFYYLADEPWRIVGTGHLSDRQRQDQLRFVIDDLLMAGIRPQVTVFGTAVPDRSRRTQLVDQCCAVLAEWGHELFLVDGVNEPIAIGFAADPRRPYDEVREVARQIASYSLDCWLSPSSPNLLHAGVDGREATDQEIADDVEALMAGLPAAVNAITPHWGRNPWKPHRPLGPFAAGKTIVNDEPRGVESSVSAISRPEDFAADYAASVKAGDAGYTFHGEPGVWHGYCDTRDHPDWQHNNSLPTWQKVPQIEAIVAQLKAIREGGAAPPIEPPEDPDVPLKPREQFFDEFRQINAFYESDEGLKRPGGMVIDTARPVPADTEAMAAWGYDLMAGKSVEDIKAAIRQSDEWKQKHGAA